MRISVLDTQEKILTKVLMLKGEKGDKGDAGELTNLDTALSTTSTNAVQNKVITNALNTLTENSATNSFSDGIDSLFKKVVSSIVPVQAGSGTPSPSNPRAISGFTECTVLNRGINQWDEEWETGGLSETDGSETSNANFVRSGFNPLTGSISIYGYSRDSRQVVIYLYDASQNYIGFRVITNTSYTTPSNTAYFRIRINNMSSDIAKGIVSINYPATDTAYHAYTANTATISFGSAGTVYGGTVDLISGKLVVDKEYYTLTNISNLGSFTSSAQYGSWARLTDIGVQKIDNLNVMSISNMALGVSYNDRIADPTIDRVFTDETGQVCLRTKASANITTLEDFKTYFNNAVVIYDLATPIEYQLTPAQLRSLVGTNNLTSSTGEVTEVEYITNDTIAWLLDLINA